MMGTGLVLLCVTVGVLTLGPALLGVGHWPVRHPRSALALWAVTLVAGAASLLAGTLCLVSCAFGTHHGHNTWAGAGMTALGMLALAVLVGVAGLVGSGSEIVLDAAHGNRRMLLGLAHTTYRMDRHCDLIVLDHRTPLACALPGPRPAVAVSTALLRALPPAQARAVIEHERAHLHDRHHLVTRVADVHLLWAPRLWPSTVLRRAGSTLVELAADDRAARLAGPVNLANALVTLGRQLDDPTLELRAERLTQRHHRRVTARPHRGGTGP